VFAVILMDYTMDLTC